MNGKVRERLQVAPHLPESELVALALASDRVQSHLAGHEVRKQIVVPDKLVGFVV